jgi:hypothetical protein
VAVALGSKAMGLALEEEAELVYMVKVLTDVPAEITQIRVSVVRVDLEDTEDLAVVVEDQELIHTHQHIMLEVVALHM